MHLFRVFPLFKLSFSFLQDSLFSSILSCHAFKLLFISLFSSLDSAFSSIVPPLWLMHVSYSTSSSILSPLWLMHASYSLISSILSPSQSSSYAKSIKQKGSSLSMTSSAAEPTLSSLFLFLFFKQAWHNNTFPSCHPFMPSATKLRLALSLFFFRQHLPLFNLHYLHAFFPLFQLSFH